MTYYFKIRIPTRTLVEDIAKMEDSINKTMSEFGFDEQMGLYTNLSVKASFDKEITQEQYKLLEKHVVTEFNNRFPGSELVDVVEIK